VDDHKRIQEVYADQWAEMPGLPDWWELGNDLRAALIALYFAGRRDARAETSQ
jgi:hypothetical protein